MSGKVAVDLETLKGLAILARQNDRLEDFAALSLEWAEGANNEVVKLRALLRELRPVLLYHNEHFLVQKCDAAVESPPE